MTDDEYDAYLLKGFRGNVQLINEYKQWIASRPPRIQALFREYPIGSSFTLPNGKQGFFLGIAEGVLPEDDCFLLTEINPKENYEEARRKRVKLHVGYFRQRNPR